MRVLRGGTRAPDHRRLESMIGKAVVGSAAAIALAVTASVGAAAGGGMNFGGMSGGNMHSGAMGMSTISNRARRIPRIGSTGPVTSSLQLLPFPTNDPNHYHEIKLIGRFGKDESGLTIDQQVVRIRLDGQTIPMSINGDAMSNSLQFDQGDELGQNLYRLILSKQLEVVGDRKLCAQVADAAAANSSKQILLDGFVYDRMTPYLVLVSVEDAP
jgi:hypothetical protein